MNDSLLTRIWIFYRDGFREMTLGRTLLDDYSYQTIHHVLYSKTFLLSLLLGGKTTEEKQQYVGEELIERANP